MKPGIRVEVLWSDEDLLSLRVEASNGRFAASAEMYAGHGELAAIADSLAGFPTSIDDRREVVLGTLDPAYAGSGIRMRFAVSDLSGHVAAHIRVRAPVEECRPEEETADLIVPVEAAGIDWFVATLRRMSPKPGSQAYLAQRI